MNIINIGPYQIGPGMRPLIIAEAGINHNGDIDIAKKMVKVAKEADADITKFQTHIPNAEMLPDDIGSESGSHVDRSLFEIMTDCELSYEHHIELKKVAENACCCNPGNACV